METLLPGLRALLNPHPLFVHCPLALWPTALLFWLLAAWRKSDRLLAVGWWLLGLGVLGGAAAAVTGLMAHDKIMQVGLEVRGHDFIKSHQDWMIAAMVLALITLAFFFVVRKKITAAIRWMLVVLMFATTAVAAVGADRGALLVYKYGIGTEQMQPAAPGDRPHEH